MAKDLSKRFVLALTKDPTVMVKLTAMQNGVPEEIDWSLRKLEITMLTSLFNTAANGQKNFRESMQCIDCIGQLENLTDSEAEIVLTDTDIKFLNQGWEKMADQRPGAWNKCKGLIAQLVEPKEYVELKPEPVEAAGK